MNTCANCGRTIGNMETPYQHAGRIVCPECMARLAAAQQIAPPVPGMAAPMPYAKPGTQVDETGKATASLVLGCIGLLAWLLPLIGFPVTIIGLVLGRKGLNSSSRGMAMAGVIMSTIGLVLTAINSAVGAYLGATGRL